MSAYVSIDNTFGAALIGVVVAGLLLGVSIMQAWYYFMSQKDKCYLPALVSAVMLFNFIHQALISHTVYTYLVSSYGEPAKLDTIVWSLLAEVLLNGLTALFVQSFLTHRIWMLSGNKVMNGNKPVWITSFVTFFVLAEFVCVLVFAIIALMRVKTFEELSVELKGLSVTVNALAVAGDLLIAGILSFLLQRVKTGCRSSDMVINNLTIFAVKIGALTRRARVMLKLIVAENTYSLCAVASLISILAAPNTFIYISFFFLMGRLYTNSLLAILNARKKIRNSIEGFHTSNAENVSLPSELKQRASLSELVFQHTKDTGISVQVNMSREYISDLERGMGSEDSNICERDVMEPVIGVEEDIAQLPIISSQGDIVYVESH